MKIKNAKIRSTMLGRENHGIMTFMIYISADGFDCGIGGYWLDEFNSATQTRVFRAFSATSLITPFTDVRARYVSLNQKSLK